MPYVVEFQDRRVRVEVETYQELCAVMEYVAFGLPCAGCHPQLEATLSVDGPLPPIPDDEDPATAPFLERQDIADPLDGDYEDLARSLDQECDEVDEPTKLFDETTAAVDETTASVSETPPRRRHRKPSPAFDRHRIAAINFLRQHGRPESRYTVARRCGIPKGSVHPLFRDAAFRMLGDRVWLADAPLPPADPEPPPPTEREKPAAGSPIDALSWETSEARATAAIAAEFIATPRPLSIAAIAKRLHYPRELVERCVRDSRFRQFQQGYQLKSFKP